MLQLTNLEDTYNYVREFLPRVNDELKHRYMPESFESTYTRSYSAFGGESLHLESLRVVPGSLLFQGRQIPACTVTMDVN